MLLKTQRVEPATKNVLPPRSACGAVSSTSGFTPASLAANAAHSAALPAPTITTSARLLRFDFMRLPYLDSSLLKANAGATHHFPPTGELVTHERCECTGRLRGRRIHANVRIALASLWGLDRRNESGMQPGNHCWRRGRGHHYAIPVRRLQARVALLAGRGHIGKQPRSCLSGDGNRPEFPRFDVRQGCRQVADQEWNEAAQ